MTVTAGAAADGLCTADARSPVLGVRGLSVAYGGDLANPTVDDVSFDVHAGQTVAVVGQSGSGKSTIVNAVLKLLHRRVAVAGSVRFAGHETVGLDERDFRPLRGRRIGYVPQDPTAALNPVRRIDAQIFEAYRTSKLPEYADPRRFAEQAAALLDSVGVADPGRALRAHPHQLSGGQLQRVLIGIAMAQHPDLIIADEPTSALDVTIQKTILDLVDQLKRDNGLSVLLVTHDLALAVERSDTVVVLDGGRVRERGPSEEVLHRPTSSYAKRLVSDVPNLNLDRFAPALRRRAEHVTDQLALHVVDVHKTFRTGSHETYALRGVSFDLAQGHTHALVGESGSGKSTLARIVLRLLEPDQGTVRVAGRDVAQLRADGLRDVHRNLQLVFQNPFTSLDPTYSVARLVTEPLRRYRIGSRADRRARAVEVLGLVGLDESYLVRRPGELSGGQRQRVAIARALALKPKVLILDEPTSALDVTVQAQILEVLVDLQVAFGLSYLFISHDLSVVRQIADTVTVLRRGEVHEQGPTARIFTRPESEYARTLMNSIPMAPRSAVGVGRTG